MGIEVWLMADPTQAGTWRVWLAKTGYRLALVGHPKDCKLAAAAFGKAVAEFLGVPFLEKTDGERIDDQRQPDL